jgi:hypothetical protein
VPFGQPHRERGKSEKKQTRDYLTLSGERQQLSHSLSCLLISEVGQPISRG